MGCQMALGTISHVREGDIVGGPNKPELRTAGDALQHMDTGYGHGHGTMGVKVFCQTEAILTTILCSFKSG